MLPPAFQPETSLLLVFDRHIGCGGGSVAGMEDVLLTGRQPGPHIEEQEGTAFVMFVVDFVLKYMEVCGSWTLTIGCIISGRSPRFPMNLFWSLVS
jgi:hypothetical protein